LARFLALLLKKGWPKQKVRSKTKELDKLSIRNAVFNTATKVVNLCSQTPNGRYKKEVAKQQQQQAMKVKTPRKNQQKEVRVP